MMHVTINGKQHELNKDATVRDVLRVLEIAKDRQGIAVAVAATVVPRSAWASHALHEGDVIEVVTAAQGG